MMGFKYPIKKHAKKGMMVRILQNGIYFLVEDEPFVVQ